MSNRPTPETDAAQHEGLLRTNPIPMQIVTANFARKLERERDEAKEALADWENAADHVESDHPDENHCACVPVLRKLLADARSQRDEAKAIAADLAVIASHCLGSHSFALDDTALKIAAALKRWRKMKGDL